MAKNQIIPQKEAEQKENAPRTSFFTLNALHTLGGASFAIYIVCNFIYMLLNDGKNSFYVQNESECFFLDLVKPFFIHARATTLFLALFMAILVASGRIIFDYIEKIKKIKKWEAILNQKKAEIEKYKAYIINPQKGVLLTDIEEKNNSSLNEKIANLTAAIMKIEAELDELLENEATFSHFVIKPNTQPDENIQKFNFVTRNFKKYFSIPFLVFANAVLIVITAAGISGLQGVPWFSDKNAIQRIENEKKTSEVKIAEVSAKSHEEETRLINKLKEKVDSTQTTKVRGSSTINTASTFVNSFENASRFEDEGFNSLLEGKIEIAYEKFKKCEDVMPGFHNAFEIQNYLKDKVDSSNVEYISRIQCHVADNYYWKAPPDLIQKLKEKCN